MFRDLLRRLLGGQKRPTIKGSPMANAMVRAQLMKSGDDGVQARAVRHYAYPRDDNGASRYEVFEFLTAFDLVLSEAAVENGVIFEHRSEVASEAFDSFTSRMFDELDAMGWRYDGWECAVVQG